MFTINLGPFSGKNAPEIHYHPSITDRILEGTAALCLLSGIGIVCWNYFHTDILSDYGVYGIFISIVVFALLFGGAYAPVRCINFPVRIGKHNVVKQYILVTKLIRIFNIFLTMFMVAGILSDYYKWVAILKVISLIICVLSIGVYYILAFRYK